MTAAQTGTDAGFNPAQATAMQQAVAGASAQLAQYQEELERVQSIMINSENGFFITAGYTRPLGLAMIKFSQKQ